VSRAGEVKAFADDQPCPGIAFGRKEVKRLGKQRRGIASDLPNDDQCHGKRKGDGRVSRAIVSLASKSRGRG